MKENRHGKFFKGGLTAVAVVAVSLLMIIFFFRFPTILNFFNKILSILAPIIFGGVLAFLIAPIYNFCCKTIMSVSEGKIKNRKTARTIGKVTGTVVSVLFLCVVVVGFCWMIIPQLYTSIVGIINNTSVYVINISNWLHDMFESNPSLEASIMEVYHQGANSLQKWLNTHLIPNLDNLESFDFGGFEKIVGGVSTGVYTGLKGLISVISNSFIGVIVMVYLLNIKDELAAQGKKMIYAFFPVNVANGIVDEFRYIHRVFSGFFIGKMIDSLIIGMICYVMMNILKLPFTVLISVIIGVTNVIPFFGPFIGAIPCSVLVFLISPRQCLIFVLLILVLQQFDGNILGPRILGNSTGLPSFWVLFSILLFGGLWSFFGMIVAVPLTAVIFDLLAKLEYHKLREKNLSPDTRDYRELKRIDEETNQYLC